jgi:DNA-directed RNA polymerase
VIDHRKLITEAIGNGQMQYVLEAVNHVQSTPWAINMPVLAALEWAWSEGIDIPGLPSPKLASIPEKLSEAEWGAMDDRARKGRRIHIANLRERNRRIVADMAVMTRDLETAKELSRYERFYLPHNLDFRGRVYPVCHFSHQRSGHVKALFRFADGCAFGEFGGAWLGVHLANCGDFGKVSKQSFQSRLDWVASAEPLIIAVARDPRGTVEWWCGADDPFGFLAACMEYSGWVESGRSEAFVGFLPVALDGSNSGLQHYSAALRAEAEAALVSLVPSDEPADLYQTVADDVVEAVKAAAEGNAHATLALAVGIGRGLVKRNVMTFAYSSEQYGFRQQLLEDTMRPLNDLVLIGKLDRNPWSLPREDGSDDGGFQMTGYLAQHIYRSVTRTVRRATEGMDFFKKVAGLLAHEKLPLTWTSPVGLPVMHKYSQWETKAVKLFLYDRAVPVTDAGPQDKLTDDGDGVIRQVRANIRTRPTDMIDRDKARSAVAPNVIHSMDGAHLMLTVLGAVDAAIEHLALIHDSFGTHAGRTQEFFHIIRQAMVDLYEGYCPFEEVLEAARAALSDKRAALLPPLPAKGSLTLGGILEADYAFA